MTDSKHARRTLRRDETFKVAGLLAEWENEIRQTLPTYKATANKLTDVLGFIVTEANLRGIAHDLGMTWAPARTKPRGAMSKEHIYSRVRLLEEQVHALRTAIEALCDQIAEPYPPMVALGWPTHPSRPAAEL